VHSSLITHGENGYLFEAGNSDALVRLLEKAIKNKAPLLGFQARQEILENWSAKKEAERLIDMYLT
jgi:glycosyltransferase involved in cell wall biosynthesis